MHRVARGALQADSGDECESESESGSECPDGLLESCSEFDSEDEEWNGVDEWRWGRVRSRDNDDVQAPDFAEATEDMTKRARECLQYGCQLLEEDFGKRKSNASVMAFLAALSEAAIEESGGVEASERIHAQVLQGLYPRGFDSDMRSFHWQDDPQDAPIYSLPFQPPRQPGFYTPAAANTPWLLLGSPCLL